MTFRSRPLLDLAQDEHCTARIPGYCNGRRDTTVSSHFPEALGTGHKQPDWRVAWTCCDCHDVIDGRRKTHLTLEQRIVYWERGHKDTLDQMFNRGLVIVKGTRGPKEVAWPTSSKSLPHPGYSR